MKNKYNKPRVTNSKKTGTCIETGNKIEKFDTILLDPKGMKTYCKSSKTFIEFSKASIGVK